MAKSLTEVRNMPRGVEVHTSDPFSGNDNNRRVHERRMKAESELAIFSGKQGDDALHKFLMETSGGFHATEEDWTTVGRSADGFPVVKGSPEDVSAKPAAPASTPKPAVVAPAWKP